MIYIDVEKNISKVININKKLSNIIELKLLCRKNNICIFVSSQNKYIELDLKNKTLKEVNNNSIPESNEITMEKVKDIMDENDYETYDIRMLL